jgi:hypothetical protein
MKTSTDTSGTTLNISSDSKDSSLDTDVPEDQVVRIPLLSYCLKKSRKSNINDAQNFVRMADSLLMEVEQGLTEPDRIKLKNLLKQYEKSYIDVYRQILISK